MRLALTLFALVVGTVAAVSPVSAMTTSGVSASATRYTTLQMNLCLSGVADCYESTGYPSVVDEAAAQVVDRAPEAVTLNEVCRGDAADLAHRTGYEMRFSAVIIRGERFRCVRPGGRGVFGLAVLTRAEITTSHGGAFAAQAGAEQRRWMCATTASEATVCTAHLSTRGSARERRANTAQCRELRGVLTRYDGKGATVFGGDVNRQRPCAPATMWARSDTAATQRPGIQHAYGSRSLLRASPQVAPATHTDHDFFLTESRRAPTVQR